MFRFTSSGRSLRLFGTKRSELFVLIVTACLASWSSLQAQTKETHAASPRALSPNARELYVDAMATLDSSYDPAAHLILRPHVTAEDEKNGRYMVRESTWYALGLLLRDGPGDRPRAVDILTAALANQYVDPEARWYGSFKRTPEEPLPAVGTIAFTGYDPNWRHFIGTTFELILIDFPDRLPADLAARLYHSIDLSVAGEIHDGRLKESYTNIALMYGALWDFAAAHDHRADWAKQAAAWNQEVYRLFRLHGTFYEYNSPTYCGVDIYGLAFWRKFGSTAAMRSMGQEMEAGLWNELAAFYQPDLRNLAGPYDRSYGMDMESYVAVVGVWLRTVMPRDRAPLPEHMNLKTDHLPDLWFATELVLLGTEIPQDAMKRFQTFAGPHLVERRIDDQRVATAWIGDNGIWGGESTSHARDVGPASQFHPVTVQWRMPSGKIGWIMLSKSPKIDAVADRTGVTLTTDGDVTFRIAAGDTAAIRSASWTLPGMTVDVAFDGTGFSTRSSGEFTEVTYAGTKRIRLTMHPSARAR